MAASQQDTGRAAYAGERDLSIHSVVVRDAERPPTLGEHVGRMSQVIAELHDALASIDERLTPVQREVVSEKMLASADRDGIPRSSDNPAPITMNVLGCINEVERAIVRIHYMRDILDI